MRKLNHILYILLIICLLVTAYSCKLFEKEDINNPKDSTSPIVNLTNDGGNEISREVTLYLDIEDDSMIEIVEIMIDDTIAVSVTSNFDTIRFDVTPFADESEHQLFAKVTDSERNIGESEKHNVIITEYPGWRVFDNNPIIFGHMTIDDNDRIWMSDYSDIYIYDINANSYSNINQNNSDYPINAHEGINGIRVADGSRVWILHGLRISEYDLESDTWIQTIELPPDTVEGYIPANINHLYVETFAVDGNNDLWIGTVYGSWFKKLIHYNHNTFNFFQGSGVDQIRFMELHPDGTLYLAGDGGVDAFKNNEVYSFDNYTGNYADDTVVVIDSSGNVWSTGQRNSGSGIAKFNGINWETILIPNITYSDGAVHGNSDHLEPLFTSKDGVLYCERHINTGQDNYGGNSYRSRGIATYDGINWQLWDQYDSPFNDYPTTAYQYDDQGMRIGGYYGIGYPTKIVEVSNGDIWISVWNGLNEPQLMRYRPSLGGYP